MGIRIEVRGFRTAAGRRMALLFLFASVLPMSWVSLEAYRKVDAQLKQQARNQVHWVTAATATAIMDRLRLAETELDLAARLKDDARADGPTPAFRVLDRVRVAGPGPGAIAPLVESNVRRSGGADAAAAAWRIVTAPDEGGLRVWLGRAASPHGWIWATLNPQALVATARVHSEGPGTLGICLLLPDGSRLACDADLSVPDIAASVDSVAKGRPAGLIIKDRPDAPAVWLGYRTLFLKGRYSARPWVVVTAFDQAALLAPASDFHWSFPRVLLVVIALVLLVSHHQIQRSLEPLEALSAASRRIEEGDLEARVDVQAHDEFSAVAGAFNRMAAHVGRQMRSLEALRRLDRAVLGDPSRETLANAVLDFGADTVSADAVAVWLGAGTGDDGAVHSAMAGNSGGKRRAPMPRGRLGPPAGELAVSETAPRWAGRLPPFCTEHFRRFLTVTADAGRQEAIVLLASYDAAAFGPEIRPAALQLAEQVALAVSTVQLVERLAQANAGSLGALSRSMDLVSPWTAGHAERVATLSVAMGRHLGMAPGELERLQRAALLHDIGMFGVPPGVIERSAHLTPQETDKWRDHPALGARVLAPLAAFADIVPVVAQHHERWDGTGYPAGLSGDTIHPMARIVAVADAFDNLTSQRPDRERLPSDAALSVIQDGAGRAFEPRSAEALQAVLHITVQRQRQETS